MFRTILRIGVAAGLLAAASVALLAAPPDVSSPEAPRLIGDFEPREHYAAAKGLSGGAALGFSAIDPSGGTVARADSNGDVQIWDVKRGKQASGLTGRNPKKRINPSEGSHTDLAFSANGQTLVARDASADRGGRIRLRIWTGLATHSKLIQIPLSRAVFAVSPDGRLVAGVGKDDEAVSIWDTKSGDVVTRIPFAKQGTPGLAGDLRGMVFTLDAKELVLDDSGEKPAQRKLVAYGITPAAATPTAATGRVVCETDVPFKAIYGGQYAGGIWIDGLLQTSMSFPDGGKTLVTLSSPKPGQWRIHYWDLAKGGEQRAASTFSRIVQEVEDMGLMAMSPYGDTLAVGAEEPPGTRIVEGLPDIRIFDLATGKIRTEITFPAPKVKSPVRREMFSLFVDAAGKYLGTHAEARNVADAPHVEVWELASPQGDGPRPPASTKSGPP